MNQSLIRQGKHRNAHPFLVSILVIISMKQETRVEMQANFSFAQAYFLNGILLAISLQS